MRALQADAEKQIIEEHFDAISGEEDWSQRYNIAPTQPVAVIRQNPKEPTRELSRMRWGLIPRWAKDSSAAARLINARSETVSTKPAFRDAMKSRRYRVSADGFYEDAPRGSPLVSSRVTSKLARGSLKTSQMKSSRVMVGRCCTSFLSKG